MTTTRLPLLSRDRLTQLLTYGLAIAATLVGCSAETTEAAERGDEAALATPPSDVASGDEGAEGSPSSVNGLAANAAAPPLSKKGIWVWGSSVRGHERTFVSWLAAHGFSDVFVLVKGVSGDAKYDVLASVLRERRAAHPTSLRVWAWVVGFNDTSHARPDWRYLVGHWVDPTNEAYRVHLADVVSRAVDPARGAINEAPDGVMLDDSFQWPSASYGGTTADRVRGLMGAVDAIKVKVDGASRRAGRSIKLGFAPHPEAASTPIQTTATGPITSPNATAYGQDFGELGKRCDLLVPETYRYGFYPENRAWISTVASNIRREIAIEQGEARARAVVVAPALVLYRSDTDATPIPAVDLKGDRDEARGAARTRGFSLFRYTSGAANPGTGSDGRDQPSASQVTSAIDAP